MKKAKKTRESNLTTGIQTIRVFTNNIYVKTSWYENWDIYYVILAYYSTILYPRAKVYSISRLSGHKIAFQKNTILK